MLQTERTYVRVKAESADEAVKKLNEAFIESRLETRADKNSLMLKEEIPAVGDDAPREYIYTAVMNAPAGAIEKISRAAGCDIRASDSPRATVSGKFGFLDNPFGKIKTALLEYGLGENAADSAVAEILKILFPDGGPFEA